jgi:phospholipid/cholesterol/gamma-HCH transport system permease protein
MKGISISENTLTHNRGFAAFFPMVIRKTRFFTLEYVRRMGAMGIFFFKTLLYTLVPPFKIYRCLKQIQFIGFQSLLLIVLTGGFSGMVLGFQGFYSLSRFGSDAFLGPMVGLALIKELGPVIAALMVTGRAGSAIAAEIGIMRISEQIDALELMGLNPYRYLMVPNLIAAMICLPLLTALFDVVGIFGGYLIGGKLLGVGAGTYFGEMAHYVEMKDVWKAFTNRSVSVSSSPGFVVSKGTTPDIHGVWFGRGEQGHHPGRCSFFGIDSGVGLFYDVHTFLMIKIKDLKKSFDGHDVLKGISFEVGKGRGVCPGGRERRGQERIAEACGGAHETGWGKRDGGWSGNRHCRTGSPAVFRERLGFLFQGGALFDSMNVFDNVAFPLKEKSKLSKKLFGKKLWRN